MKSFIFSLLYIVYVVMTFVIIVSIIGVIMIDVFDQGKFWKELGTDILSKIK